MFLCIHFSNKIRLFINYFINKYCWCSLHYPTSKALKSLFSFYSHLSTLLNQLIVSQAITVVGVTLTALWCERGRLITSPLFDVGDGSASADARDEEDDDNDQRHGPCTILESIHARCPSVIIASWLRLRWARDHSIPRQTFNTSSPHFWWICKHRVISDALYKLLVSFISTSGHTALNIHLVSKQN